VNIIDSVYCIQAYWFVNPERKPGKEMKPNSEAKSETRKVDRRIVRSRQALRAALMQLIQEKGFNSISVEEITDKANLGRATFYLHYQDKEDLLLDEFRNIAQNQVQILSKASVSIWKSYPDSLLDGNVPSLPLLRIFEHAAQNASLYRILLRDENSQRIRTQLGEIANQAIYAILQAKRQNEPLPNEIEVPGEWLAAYFNGALLNSLKWWLEQENAPDPIHMTKMFQQLFFPGIMKILGVEAQKPR
jgi:AcrR family transcriptional regulator